jgi:hypothetical protein
MFVATVLYEDSMQPGAAGRYPLHDLVMRLVEDEINGETHILHKRVDKNPRNGIGNLLSDVAVSNLIAGSGKLFLLVDRDRVAEYVELPRRAPNEDVVRAILDRSDAPHKVKVFFLHPNCEGLLHAIRECDASLLPNNVDGAMGKDLNDRDIVFNEVKKARYRDLRDCIREKQDGLDALARAIAALLSTPGE